MSIIPNTYKDDEKTENPETFFKNLKKVRGPRVY